MSATGWHQSILKGINNRLGIMAELHPHIYLLLATIMAVAGYACLLLFPMLVLAGVVGMYQALAAPGGVAWLQLLAWLPVTGLGGIVSYRLLQFRPALPAGVVLEREMAPALFRLVEETSAHYDCPVIHRIVVTGAYQLDVVTTPHRGLSLWSTHTLVVGLPLLHCLSNNRFECQLARRLGQFSRRSNPLLGRLYGLRSVWPGYRLPALGTDSGFLPLQWWFSIYAPLYTAVSMAAARFDELHADSYAMELFADEEVLDAITTDAVQRLFLREKYWPAVRKLEELDPAAVRKSHSGMYAVLEAGLTDENIGQWVTRAMTAELQWDEPWPSLARRIDNIGHATARMEPHPMESAAEGYLSVARQDLEARLDNAPSERKPEMPTWPAQLDGLQRRLQFVMCSLLHRRKNSLHPGEIRP